MRKNFGNDMGCFGIAIMLILTALCPPLVIIYLVIYAFIYDKIGFDNFFTALQVIGLALVLILSPVVTMGSIFTFGFEETWKESALLVVITLLEIIGLMIFIITSYKTSVARKNETPEERNKHMEEEKIKCKEKEKQLKEYRLNKPFDRNEKHVIALGLYDQLLDSSKLRYQQEIKNLVSQNANLSRSTWEVYYHRILVREPSPQELQDIYYKKWSEISDKWGLSFDKRDEEISLFKKDWNKDWLSAAIKWNVDLGRYNWMKNRQNILV